MGTTLALPQADQTFIIDATNLPAKNEEQEDKQEVAAEDDGKGNHKLSEDLVNAFKALLRHYGVDVDKVSRREEVREARRQRFYDAGNQYIYFNNQQQVFLPVVAGVVMSVGTEAVSMPRYCAVYDIYKPYRRNYSAVLCQNPPGVNFIPVDPGNAQDIKIAEAAEKYSGHYDQVNNVRAMQAKIARLFWTDGRVVGWTRNVVNGEKWGKESEEEGGEDRSEEITTLGGVLEWKVFPISAADQDELIGAIYSDDPEINKAKEEYDWIKENIQPGPSGAGESAFERNARLGILQGQRLWQQSQDSFKHLAERQVMFLRPAAFNHVEKEVAQQLKQMFPRGVRAVFVGGEYAESWHESLDDCLKIDHALDGDGMKRPSWGFGLVPVQDAYNSYRNYRQEMHDYGAPWTGVDTQLLDQNGMREWVAQPGEFKPLVNPREGTALAEYFFQPQALTVPSDMIQAEQDLRDQLAQLVTAVQPALFGAQISKDDRVGVYQMAREQAMGVMSLPWGVIQGMFAAFKRQAVLAAAAKRRSDQVLRYRPKTRRGRRGKPVIVNIADLQAKGNFRAIPDQDSSFPSTRAMKSQAFDKFMGAAESNPLLAEAAQQPDNMELGAELEGMATDIDIPAARAWRRQLNEIDQLLETGPIPPSRQEVEAAEMKAAALLAVTHGVQGQVAPELPPEQKGPTPEQWADPNFIKSGAWLDNQLMMSMAKCSVPIQKLDFHPYHMAAIKDWYNTEAFERELEAGNRLGLANLLLHYGLHEQAPPDKKPGDQTPPKKSINYKDLDPEGRQQLAAQGGIMLAPPGPAGTGVPPAPPQ